MGKQSRRSQRFHPRDVDERPSGAGRRAPTGRPSGATGSPASTGSTGAGGSTRRIAGSGEGGGFFGASVRVKVAVLIGVAGLILAGLIVGAVAFAATLSSGKAANPPAGTQVFAENDHTHVTGLVNYDHNPPAGGPHNPTPLNCGVYTEVVPNENAVHSLEHGAVWITYTPTLAADQVQTLQNLVTSNYVGTERYVILSPYLGLPTPVVASAWGAQLQVQSASDPRLLQFIQFYAGGSQGGEPGGPCAGGVGSPVE